ncbi:MAG: hypothetical protein DMG42_00725 [Acidobacteria bacterium]|nr:MAG: hypothetical protein DMG42_00725 [Acidobacteriota bacterium]
MPALRATKVEALAFMRQDSNGARWSRSVLAKGLIVVQIAASLMLLSGAGLLKLRTSKLTALHTGMSVENMLVMKIGLGWREYQQTYPPSVYQEIIVRVQGVPGVRSAALGANFAFSSGDWVKSVWVEGQPPEQEQMAAFNVVSPSFFSTAGIPVLEGREFTDRDVLGAPKVVVINEAFAKRYFPGQNPVGRHFGDKGEKSILKYEVIGVVADSRNMFLKKAPGPMLYAPLLQDEHGDATNVVLHVRTRGNPKLILDRLRAEIRVIAYAVGRRTRESGVRLALGATPRNVLQMIVRETLTLVAAGAILGLPLAFICTRVLKSTLFGVEPQDPITAAACLIVLLLAGLAAGYVPARRAAVLEPVSALRTE